MSRVAPGHASAAANAPGGEPPAPRRDNGWTVLAHDRRAWMALGLIAGTGALLGALLGAGVPTTPLFFAVLAAAMGVSIARMGWDWLRGRSRRARLRESVLSRVEEYGGGVYGTGAGITLLVLSAATLQQEWAQASGPGDFLRGMTLDFWMGFSGDSIRNAVQAGIWPLHWYANHGLVAALAVGAAAWAGDALADALRRREPLVVDVPSAEGQTARLAE